MRALTRLQSGFCVSRIWARSRNGTS
jgi:hypothetical protein